MEPIWIKREYKLWAMADKLWENNNHLRGSQ